MVSLVLALSFTCQTPMLASPNRIAEIRRTLNRFDDLAKIAMIARAEAEAKKWKDSDGNERRLKLYVALTQFARKDLNIPLPWQAAEDALVDDIVENAAKPYDNVLTTRQWLDTVNGKVWGWYDPSTRMVMYYPHEQPTLFIVIQ